MIVLDYSTKNKINIHESTGITLNNELDKQMGKKINLFLQKNSKYCMLNFLLQKGELNSLPLKYGIRLVTCF